MKQIGCALPIFEFLHSGAVRIWIFNYSSAHEAFAPDSLNVKNMNINPGGKQRSLHSTIIPLNNCPPTPGDLDTRSQVQLMVYPANHPTPEL